MLNNRTPEELDKFIDNCARSSPLQYSEWINIKRVQGWEGKTFLFTNDMNKPVSAASVLLKKIPLSKFYFAFLPFGPVLKEWSEVQFYDCITSLIIELKNYNVIFLKIHPYYFGELNTMSRLKKARKILYSTTFLIDLNDTEDNLFARLHKKLRNEIRKAEKLGTEIISDNSEDGIKQFYEMYKETFTRTNYAVQPFEMFEQLYNYYIKSNRADLKFTIAKEKRISAALFLKTSNTYVYMWGASISDPTYNKYEGQKYLIWQSILEAKANGASFFDLGGVTQHPGKGSKREGIFTFKSRFGGTLCTLPGTFDVYINKFLGPIYSKFLDIYMKIREN